MKKEKIALLALCGMLVCGGTVGGAYALYTGLSDTTANQFTIKAGKLAESDGDKVGEIEEDKWDAENAGDLMPNSEVEKNPKFISNAEYEAWCIMKVSIPTASMKIGGENTASVYDAVSLKGLDLDNWSLVGEKKSSTVGKNSVYYYGYKTTRAKGEETTELFTSIKVPDISELETNLTDTVDVAVHVVQAEGYETVAQAFAALGIV